VPGAALLLPLVMYRFVGKTLAKSVGGGGHVGIPEAEVGERSVKFSEVARYCTGVHSSLVHHRGCSVMGTRGLTTLLDTNTAKTYCQI
jgi:hypothetical protein